MQFPFLGQTLLCSRMLWGCTMQGGTGPGTATLQGHSGEIWGPGLTSGGTGG